MSTHACAASRNPERSIGRSVQQHRAGRREAIDGGAHLGIDLAAEVQYIAAGAYGVDGFPFTTLLDGDGKVVARWSGEREPDQVLDLITSNLDLG